MKHHLIAFVLSAVFVAVVLADHHTSGDTGSTDSIDQVQSTTESMETTTCPFLKAHGNNIPTGKCLATGVTSGEGAVCPVTGKRAGDMKAVRCGSGSCSECKRACCSEKTAVVSGDSQAQTVCPVKGKKINKDYYVDHNGKRIYLCCPGCVAKVKSDPEKYIERLEDQGIVLETVKTMEPEGQS
ncbi:hypothetical protein JXA80_09050 [bacterium]|nr:hypothetical protein [candidate division CSSED10-310 bacterium]